MLELLNRKKTCSEHEANVSVSKKVRDLSDIFVATSKTKNWKSFNYNRNLPATNGDGS